MSTLSDVRTGIKTRLETIAGLRVYDYPQEDLLEYPCVVLEVTGPISYDLTLGGDGFRSVIVATLFVQRGTDKEGWEELDEFRSPTGAKSIKAAIRGDRTLGGKVDTSDVRLSDQVTRDRNAKGLHLEFSSRFNIEFVKC